MFHKYHEDISMHHFLEMLEEMREKLSAQKAFGRVEFPYFKPANITFFTLSSALGNWGVRTHINRIVEIERLKGETREALSDMYCWVRQEKSVDILRQLYGLCQDAFNTMPEKMTGFSDQNYPPIVIAAPYTTKDVRDVFKLIAKSEASMQSIDKMVELEQTPNYCYDVKAEDIGDDLLKAYSFFRHFHASRQDFLDIVAYLHCSFRFSPYLRGDRQQSRYRAS